MSKLCTRSRFGLIVGSAVSLLACSGNNSTPPDNTGGTASVGGSDTNGGASSGGVPAATGGTSSVGTGGATQQATGGNAAIPTGGSVSTSTGGSKATGGSVASATGGANATGGMPAATGGLKGLGGQATATGGSTPTGGKAATGGSDMGTGGAASGAGGNATTGGNAATGGVVATGGKAAGGKAATGGMAPTGGSAGTTGGSGGGNSTTGFPAGYPSPTAANVGQCQSVQPSGGYCPGGGVGPVCIECLFGGSTYDNATSGTTALETSEAGNYAVTVTLGGTAASQVYVSAESNRGLTSRQNLISIGAGQTADYAFVVNVRPRESEPAEAVAGGYAGLDLFFSGPTASPPEVTSIGYALVSAATKPIMVYIASDSTACDQPGDAFGGWGQMLPEYFAPPVGVANYADSGESSSSFYGNGLLWGAIKSHWVAGDWVLIQFGHNDKGVADSVVQTNLEKYVTDALAANVTPIIISPPARVQMTNGVEGDQSSLHAAAAQAAATAKNVAYIDLTALSTAWYNSLGSQAAALAYHANGSDATHTNIAGAEKISGLVVNAMKTQNIPLAQYLR